jgi:hypothetical protein
LKVVSRVNRVSSFSRFSRVSRISRVSRLSRVSRTSRVGRDSRLSEVPTTDLLAEGRTRLLLFLFLKRTDNQMRGKERRGMEEATIDRIARA